MYPGKGYRGLARPHNTNGMMMSQNSLKLPFTGDDIELSHLEINCLKLAANGHRSSDICRVLDVTEREVEFLLSSAADKLGARNRLHAIGLAVSQGLIGIEGK